MPRIDFFALFEGGFRAPFPSRACLLAVFCILLVVLVPFPSAAEDPPAGEQIILRVDGYSPDARLYVARVAFEFMKEHPNVKIEPFRRLRIESGMGAWDTTLFMAFAGETAPDLVMIPYYNFREYQGQGFWLSLEDFYRWEH